MSDEIITPFIEKAFPIITSDIKGRGYILHHGLELFGSVENAKKYMRKTMNNIGYKVHIQENDFVTILTYGHEQRGKMSEVWMGKVSGNWPKDVEYEGWTFDGKGSNISPPLTESRRLEKNNWGSDIIMSREDEFREKTKTIEEYIDNMPNIDDLLIHPE